jgi:hypothetical protein
MLIHKRSWTAREILGQLLTVDPNPPGDDPGDGGGGAPPADPAPTDSDDLSKLRGALQKERERARQEEAARKQLEAQLREVGQVDPKLLDEARQRAREAEQQRLMVEQQTTLRLQEQERKYQEQLARLTSELQMKASAAEREALRVKAEREFLATKGLTDASEIDGRTPFDYIWQLFGSQYAEDKGGLYLVDADGTPALDPETGKRITLREHFAKLRKDPVHGMHFQPEYGSGSGARSGRDGRVSSTADLTKVPTGQLFRDSFGARRRTA